MQHCDKVIPQEYPDKAKERTKINKQMVVSNKVELILGETLTKTWTLIMDRSEVYKLRHKREQINAVSE